MPRSRPIRRDSSGDYAGLRRARLPPLRGGRRANTIRCDASPRSIAGPIRVRIAPSPTGPLHIGTARTALFNYLFARHHGGTFILRLEDTDQARGSIAYEKDILDGLHWLGITWDEGPAVAGEEARGPHAPYRQMERLPLYAAAAADLLARDLAYPCYCTAEELEADRRRAEAEHRPPRYIGRCAHLTPDERPRARPRAAPPRSGSASGDEVVAFDDLVRGHVEIDTDALGGDFVIVRGDGTPLYHFTVVVDDAAMEISHVIRGEDHLTNTPKHILLFRALGHEPPVFAHLPLILNPDRTKMSKRKSQTAVGDYLAQGFVREALVNYLALLGWSTGTEEEILDLDELVGALRSRPRPEGGRDLRPRAPRVAERPVDPTPVADELVERLRPFLEADAGGGPNRSHAGRRGDPCPGAARPGAAADPRGDRGPRRASCSSRTSPLDPAILVPKRWDPATTHRGPSRRAVGDREHELNQVR